MGRDDEHDASAGRTEREFAGIVERLRRADPRFARRFSVPAISAHLPAGAVTAVAGVLATVLLGVVPLAVGLQLDVAVLLALGAVCCAVLPVAAPVATGSVLRRVRPLWA